MRTFSISNVRFRTSPGKGFGRCVKLARSLLEACSAICNVEQEAAGPAFLFPCAQPCVSLCAELTGQAQETRVCRSQEVRRKLHIAALFRLWADPGGSRRSLTAAPGAAHSACGAADDILRLSSGSFTRRAHNKAFQQSLCAVRPFTVQGAGPRKKREDSG